MPGPNRSTPPTVQHCSARNSKPCDMLSNSGAKISLNYPLPLRTQMVPWPTLMLLRTGGLSLPEANLRKILKKHLLRLLHYQREYWRKRCTIRWIRFGDEDPEFFQAMASERYTKNNIPALTLSDGSQVEDHAGKEAIIYQAFKGRLGKSGDFQMKFDLPSIIKRVEDLDQLTTPFTPAEIDAIIHEMPADRAPGLDGFTGTFLKA